MPLDPQTAPRPDGLADLIRRIEDIERRQKSDLASIADSFQTTVASLTDLVNAAVSTGQAGVTLGGFGVSTSVASIVSGSISVPAGFTRAAVFASAHVAARNDTAVAEFLYVGAKIGTVDPALIPHPVGASSWVAGAGSSSRLFAGLSGGSIAVSAQARSNVGAWSTNASAIATIDAIALFYR